MEASADLSQLKWKGLSTFSKGTSLYNLSQDLLKSVRWDTLCAHASNMRKGLTCSVETPIAMGGRHLIRILTFEDGVRWIARLRLPKILCGDESVCSDSDEESNLLVEREIACLTIVLERTSTPVPKVYGHIKAGQIGVGASVIFMEYLAGNVALDLCFNSIPPQFKPKFFYQMALAQVSTAAEIYMLICGLNRAQTHVSTILFPMIGSVTRRADGKYDVGPLPGIGGPFETASDFFRAWAATAKFPHSREHIMSVCGDLGDDISKSTAEIPSRLSEMADQICSNGDRGPFPLVHVDYGHNNIVVTPDYDIMGVIDWEHAFAAPWQTVDYPLTGRATPRSMDAPWNYGPDGAPLDPDLQTRYKERMEYLSCVRAAEESLSVSPILSSTLADVRVQDIAAAMRLFAADGKMGYYSQVLNTYT